MLLTEAGSADGPIPFAKLRKKSERGILPPCFTWLGGKDSVKRAPAPTLPTEGKKPQNPFSRKYQHRKPPPETCSGIPSTTQRIPPRQVSYPFFNNLKEAQPPATRTPINKPQGTNQQTTENQLTNHSNPINKLPCIPHNSLPSDAPHCIRHRSALHQPSQRAAQAHAAHCLSRSGKMRTDKKHIIRPPALRCHAPHLHPDRKRSLPRPPGHAFTPYKDRRPTSRLTSHHKKKQSFT